MNYQVRKGVALFQMCGEYFLFPSRESGIRLPFIISVSDRLAVLLLPETGDETKRQVLSSLNEQEKKKLSRLTVLRYIEEAGV